MSIMDVCACYCTGCHITVTATYNLLCQVCVHEDIQEHVCACKGEVISVYMLHVNETSLRLYTLYIYVCQLG